MSKKCKILGSLYLIFMGIILFTSDSLAKYAGALEYVGCGSAEGIPKPIPQLTTIAYTLLTVGAPLVLMIFSIITLISAIRKGDADKVLKAKEKLFKKFIMAAFIFLIAAIVQFVITRVTSNDNDTKSVSECISCFLYYNGTDEGDNCHASSSGNNVTDETHSNAYSNIGEPTTSNRTGKKGTKTIYVGDSRTVGFCGQATVSLYVGSCRGELAVARGAMGYAWFKSTAISSVNGLLNRDPNTRYNIVILMGANDVGSDVNFGRSSAQKYASLVVSQAQSEWKNHYVVFASVTPIRGVNSGGRWPVSKASIDTFNTQMEQSLRNARVKNLKYCDISTGLGLTNSDFGDAVHYRTSGYNKIENAIKSKCLS